MSSPLQIISALTEICKYIQSLSLSLSPSLIVSLSLSFFTPTPCSRTTYATVRGVETQVMPRARLKTPIKRQQLRAPKLLRIQTHTHNKIKRNLHAKARVAQLVLS